MKAMVVEFANGTTEVALVLGHLLEPHVQLLSAGGTEFIVAAAICRVATDEEFKRFWKEKLKNAKN